MRNAVVGGQPRRTSSVASWRSTLRSSASTRAASLSKPTAISCSIRQPSTRAAGSGDGLLGEPRSRPAWSVGSPLMPLSTHATGSRFCSSTYRAVAYADASAWPSSRACSCEAVPLDPRREPLTVTHRSAPPRGSCVVCTQGVSAGCSETLRPGCDVASAGLRTRVEPALRGARSASGMSARPKPTRTWPGSS